MKKMMHILPEKCVLKHVLIGYAKMSREEEQALYDQKIVDFEKKCEQSLIETLGKIGVRASVKSDRCSLPYKEELLVTLNGESYLNGPFEFHRVAKKIVKEILDKNLYKVRFYMYINLVEGKELWESFGKVEYRFRYYPH